MSKSALPAIAGTMHRFDFWQETLDLLQTKLAGLPADDPGDERQAERLALEAAIATAGKQKRIVYLLEIPTVKQRIEYEAELGDIGHAPGELELAELMRLEARRVFGDPSPEYELAADLAAAAGSATEDDRKAGNALLARLRTRSPEINRAMVARDRSGKLADYLAVKFFCHAIEGADFQLERDATGVTDESLTQMQTDIELVGRKIRSLMRLAGTARKNLASPSPSASSQASSTAVSDLATAEAAGSS
jgi:hypothetical protein